MSGALALLVIGLLLPTVLWWVTAASLRQRCDRRFSGRDDARDRTGSSDARRNAGELVGAGTAR